MRRIQTYVLIVGVTFSVAPIFHLSHAQQGNGNTQLLLDVQTLRQEIAELRDMVERQQYQMKRMQQTIDAQTQLSPNASGRFNQGLQENTYQLPSQGQSQLNNGQQVPNSYLSQSQPLSSEVSSNGIEANPSIGNQVDNVNATLATDNSLRNGGSVLPNGVIGQTQQDIQGQLQSPSGYRDINQVTSSDSQFIESVADSSNSYPPIVDRSVSTVGSSVPITGAGAQAAVESQLNPQLGSAANNVQNWQSTTQQSVSNGVQELNQTVSGAQGVAGSTVGQYQSQAETYINAQPPLGGVITVPQHPAGLPEAITQSGRDQVANVGQAINAAQVPVANASQEVKAPNPANRPESEYYSEGINLLKQSQYEQAAVVFEKQLEVHPQGNLADGAHYWIAEAMFLNRKLDVAKSHLKTIINEYPQSTRLPNAMLKTAYIEQSQGNQIEARILFQEIVALYPQSDAAIAAKNQLSKQN